MVLVVGILGILFSIAFVSVGNIRIIATNNSSVSVITSDLKNQQIKAMTGDTEGRGIQDNYGVKILNSSYVLFHGMSYNASDTTNVTIPIDSANTLASTFPDNTVLFASASGEIVGFIDAQNTITLTNTTSGQSKTLHLNKYGAITQVN